MPARLSRHDPLLRAAQRLQQAIVAGLGRVDRIDHIVCSLQDAHEALGRLTHQHQRARSHGFGLAAQRLRALQRRQLFQLQSLTNQLLADDVPVAAEPPALRAVLADLQQLHQEFDTVQVDLKQRWISITTDDIVLEDIALGPFEIRLLLGRIAAHPDSSAFDCIALEPNPAASSIQTTYPHLSV